MHQSGGKHLGWFLIIVIVVGVLALTAGSAHASFTFSGDGFNGAGQGIDQPGGGDSSTVLMWLDEDPTTQPYAFNVHMEGTTSSDFGYGYEDNDGAFHVGATDGNNYPEIAFMPSTNEIQLGVPLVSLNVTGGIHAGSDISSGPNSGFNAGAAGFNLPPTTSTEGWEIVAGDQVNDGTLNFEAAPPVGTSSVGGGIFLDNENIDPQILMENSSGSRDFFIGISTVNGGCDGLGNDPDKMCFGGVTGYSSAKIVAASAFLGGASSTVRIGTASLPGCLEMGNSNGSAGINYVTFLNGVMTATTTKPSNCQ